jgi:Bor protein
MSFHSSACLTKLQSPHPRTHLAWLPIMKTLALLLVAGCYHYEFAEHAVPPGTPTITHEEHVPTYVNGLVGTGRIDTTRYCANPVRTELRVNATDVLLSAVTLLIYTPHTLYVTCPTGPTTASAGD